MSTNPAKIFYWKSATLIFISIGLLLAGLSVYSRSEIQTVSGFSLEDPRSVEDIPTAVNLGSSFEAPGQPVRLRIPAIGVDAAIQSVGLAKDGTVGIPTNFTDVAWYNRGPRPGMPGSAIIDGHLDGKKVPQAVFYNLSNLKPGDEVEVADRQGKVLKFKVVRIKTYDYNAPTEEVFSSDISKIRLNLITCSGAWMKNQKLYDKRLVVFTELF